MIRIKQGFKTKLTYFRILMMLLIFKINIKMRTNNNNNKIIMKKTNKIRFNLNNKKMNKFVNNLQMNK